MEYVKFKMPFFNLACHSLNGIFGCRILVIPISITFGQILSLGQQESETSDEEY